MRRLVRSRSDAQPGDVLWDPMRGVLDARQLAGAHAIVNLAGAPIARRWTHARMQDIRDSRLRSTELIAQAVATLDEKPRVVLSGSAVGYYGDRGDEVLDEHSAPGTDFLGTLAREWEDAARPIAEVGVRLVLLRTGIVLTPSGGALQKLLLPFRAGLGGRIGSGRQWMSWISLADQLAAMEHALDRESVSGPLNLVAPTPVTNAQFTAALGHVLQRPAVIPVPEFALELVFGEMARATLLSGQRAIPAALSQSGFRFGDETLELALSAALGRS